MKTYCKQCDLAGPVNDKGLCLPCALKTNAERQQVPEARLEAAFREGYFSRETYNDKDVTDVDEQWEKARAALTAAPSAQAEPCRSDGRCQYAIDHGAEGLGHCPQRKCVMPAAQPRYTFWTGDGEAAMQPNPNGNWLWIGDPDKAPKGL